ncbi:MAG: hypothetical protein ACRD2W_19880 [Acidimicrobiales bacterium]
MDILERRVQRDHLDPVVDTKRDDPIALPGIVRVADEQSVEGLLRTERSLAQVDLATFAWMTPDDWIAAAPEASV